jgi:hypothetical protein
VSQALNGLAFFLLKLRASRASSRKPLLANTSSNPLNRSAPSAERWGRINLVNEPPDVKAETKIRVIEDAEATGETAAAYEYWRRGTGRKQLPGIIKCFGARPDFLRQVIEFSDTVHFSEGHLSRLHKEMIATYVSYLNHCPY